MLFSKLEMFFKYLIFFGFIYCVGQKSFYGVQSYNYPFFNPIFHGFHAPYYGHMLIPSYDSLQRHMLTVHPSPWHTGIGSPTAKQERSSTAKSESAPKLRSLPKPTSSHIEHASFWDAPKARMIISDIDPLLTNAPCQRRYQVNTAKTEERN